MVTTTWALYNALKFWTLYNLSEQDVQLLLMTFSDNEIKLAKICKQGDSNWESINVPRHAGFLKKENRDKHLISDNYPVMVDQNESVSDTGYFAIKDGKVVHPRLYNRYEKQVPCLISLGDGKDFLTETIDLSEGGLFFKDIIPEWVAGYFIVAVDSRFNLMCSLVEDQKEKSRVQIVSEESDPQFTLYKEWLATL